MNKNSSKYMKSMIEQEFIEHKYLENTVDITGLDSIDSALAGVHMKAVK